MSAFVSVSLVAQSGNDALTYMQGMSAISEDLKGETWQYLKAVTRGKGARKVEKKRQELIHEVSVKKSVVRAMKAYSKDGQFKNAVLDYLEMTYTVLKEDFDKILDMEDISEQSYDAMEAYILAKEKANDKLDEAFEVLKHAQELFAANNNITLIEGEKDKKSKKIEKAGNAIEYYNDVYLIFFKSYKQEAYIIDAINRRDVNSLEQNISAMVEFNEEGNQKLSELENYNDDTALKNAAKEVFKYFDEEATKHYPSMVNYFVAKDNFEKVQKMMEAKKKKDRTQQDVDQFNEAVKKFNEEVAKYNVTNEITNQGREKTLGFWNKQVEDFFDRHAN
jgi:hypothetical protein